MTTRQTQQGEQSDRTEQIFSKTCDELKVYWQLQDKLKAGNYLVGGDPVKGLDALLKKLSDTGVSLQRVRKAIVFLRQHMKAAPSGITLMSDGARIYACETEDEIIDLLKQGQGVFAIAVDRVWEDLSSALTKKKESPPRALAGAGGA